ncbi:hypothetical protein ACIQ9P_31970 [Kitasatospora sp. NPDC094019]|uniref:hypothetical protein n=1 Tax=Kitasatospora sp. NPDC094019 TaxID=3364091 RepID=UPI003815616E
MHLLRPQRPVGQDGTGRRKPVQRIGAGQVVLSGAWAAAVDLLPGTPVEATFGRLGSVSLTVGPA